MLFLYVGTLLVQILSCKANWRFCRQLKIGKVWRRGWESNPVARLMGRKLLISGCAPAALGAGTARIGYSLGTDMPVRHALSFFSSTVAYGADSTVPPCVPTRACGRVLVQVGIMLYSGIAGKSGRPRRLGRVGRPGTFRLRSTQPHRGIRSRLAGGITCRLVCESIFGLRWFR